MSSRFDSRAAGSCAVFAVVLALAGARPAAAQCGGTQLCAPGAGDCTVAADCTITVPAGGLTINLGARRLVITKNLTVAGPDGAGLTISAGDVLLNGGSIVALGTAGIAGTIVISSATNVTVQNNTLIDVSGGIAAGFVSLDALNGNISFAGRIKANGTTRGGYGGDVSLFAVGSATVNGEKIDVSGGDQAAGGSISLDAIDGSMVVGLALDARGGDGGDIEVSAGTTLQTTSNAEMNVSANGDGGSGGSIDLSAVDDVIIGGDSIGTGSTAASSEDDQSGGDGADLDIFSEIGSVTINNDVNVSGAAAGSGGGIDIEAGLNLTFSRPLVSQGSGIDGTGGDVFLVAGGTLSLPQQVDARGGPGSGGSIEAFALGNLTVSASLLATGTSGGGTIFLSGCALTVTPQGLLDSRGPGVAPVGSNFLQASSTMTINANADLLATTQNVLQHRSLPEPSRAGAMITPPPTLQLVPSLPCCVSCPVTTTTTTITTTSTTVLPTTSTTAPTSTTIPPTTTTTSSTTTTSTTSTTIPSTCGNGTVTGAEQCDDGNTVGGDCCSATCTFEAVNSPCATDSNPCTRDVCNGAGACTHPAGNAGTPCRPAAGVCDQAEACSGTSATCPADAKSTGPCRAAAGPCDQAESCDGVSNACPPDVFAPAGTSCRAAAGVCDAAETCSGTSSACPADAKRSDVCRAATGVCDVAESCNGTSDTCPADGFVPNGTTCGGGDACMTGGTCQSGVCTGAAPVSCAACETCDPVEGCVAAPRPSCRRPVEAGKAAFKLKDSAKGPDGDQLNWKWDKGAATALADFGDPTTTDGLALCVFDRSQVSASLLFRATVAPGGDCGTPEKPKPCWTSNGKNFKFKSKAGNADGITAVTLTPGESGKAKAQVKGKGIGLTGRPFGLPAPPLPLPLTVQLQSEAGQCWEADYSAAGVKKNIGEKFDAKADGP